LIHEPFNFRFGKGPALENVASVLMILAAKNSPFFGIRPGGFLFRGTWTPCIQQKCHSGFHQVRVSVGLFDECEPHRSSLNTFRVEATPCLSKTLSAQKNHELVENYFKDIKGRAGTKGSQVPAEWKTWIDEGIVKWVGHPNTQEDQPSETTTSPGGHFLAVHPLEDFHLRDCWRLLRLCQESCDRIFEAAFPGFQLSSKRRREEQDRLTEANAEVARRRNRKAAIEQLIEMYPGREDEFKKLGDMD
jgi:hypothetical protein